ncbi:MAG: 1,4-alpha-glucan branching protein domain-containing protein [Terriglobia bacterium]
MCRGRLALVLHAHLPFVRHPEHDSFLEEDWLFEAITETYIPLIQLLQRLVRDGVTSRLTLSISPTLAEMLADPFLQSRYHRYLTSRVELAEREISRTRHDPDLHPLAILYRRNFQETYSCYEFRYHRQLLQAFVELQEQGIVEIITCPGTHPFLPLISKEEVRRAHLEAARITYQRHFQKPLRGLWLAECGFEPGMDFLIKQVGFEYFTLDTHGIIFGNPRPASGVYAPVRTPAGTIAFGRDLESALQVWNSKIGFPGDPCYREFYRDLGFDAPYDYIRPFLHPDGVRRNVGIKYYRITGGEDLSRRAPYDPQRAQLRALQHAGYFLDQRREQLERLKHSLRIDPLIVAPYDAELFGHWWHEGPIFLEQLMREAARNTRNVRLVSLSEALSESPDPAPLAPTGSSWGDEGYYQVWLNEKTEWLYKHQHWAEQVMIQLANQFENAQGWILRGLNQAGRELLLAQSSDWAFHITASHSAGYAERRFSDHLMHFRILRDGLLQNRVDTAHLCALEERDNLFRTLDYRVFRSARIASIP